LTSIWIKEANKNDLTLHFCCIAFFWNCRKGDCTRLVHFPLAKLSCCFFVSSLSVCLAISNSFGAHPGSFVLGQVTCKWKPRATQSSCSEIQRREKLWITVAVAVEEIARGLRRSIPISLPSIWAALVPKTVFSFYTTSSSTCTRSSPSF
jgi:hypothetical protein